MGTHHALGYEAHPKTEIVAAADPDPENLSTFCKQFNVEKCYSSYEELLEKEKVDIAGIIVPVKVNPGAVLAAAEAGVKAIFCEKPISASLEEADRMVETCRRKGIPLACGAINRNNPYLWKARELIAKGEIGDIRSMNLYHASGEISGGGCHSLNVVRLLAGDPEVSWVTGWMERDPWSEEDQGAGGYLRFENGVECFIHMKSAIKQGVEVLGYSGVLFWDWRSIYMWKAACTWSNPVFKDLEEVPFPYPTLYRPDIYPGVMNGIQSVVDSIEKGVKPLCSGDDMRKVLEIAIALRQSHREDHKAVKLPLEDRKLKIIPSTGRFLGQKAAKLRP